MVEVAGVPSDNTTLLSVLSDFAKRGYEGSVVVTDDATVRCTRCRETLAPESLEVEEWRRMEGASDPDDMLAIIAVVCPNCGNHAAMVLHYGPEASSAESDVLVALER